MLSKFIFSLSLVIFVCSCGQKEQQAQSIKKGYFPDGKLMFERQVINDTIAEGFYREYYPNGQLKVEAMYVSNIEDGIVKSYFENGQLKYLLTYDDRNLNGPAEWYYRNGQLKTKYNNDYGKAVGDFFEYDSLGRLTSYGCRDFDELIKFEEKFSPDGQPISKFGIELAGLNANTTNLHVGDTLKLFLILATPPNTTRKLTVTIDNRKPDETETFEIKDGGGIILYKKRVVEKGNFHFVGTYSVEYSPAEKSEKAFAGTYQVD